MLNESAPVAPEVSNLPSAARCNRVYQTLLKEPAFQNILGPKTVSVTRRDNVVETYPESVVEVTARIKVSGLDANTATRDEILDAAKAYFASQASSTAPGSPVTPSVTLTADSDTNILADHAVLAVYSLLLTAKAIGENDRKPGAATRLQTLKKALEAYRPYLDSFSSKGS